MKLHADGTQARNTVTGYGATWLEVNLKQHEGSLLLMPDRLEAWTPQSFDALTEHDFEPLIAWRPEVILLGTGQRHRFPHPKLLRSLAAVRLGVEAMDTQAACRTYNILSAEGRRVLAALLPLS